MKDEGGKRRDERGRMNGKQVRGELGVNFAAGSRN